MDVILDLIIYFIISLFTRNYKETPNDDRETLSFMIFDDTDKDWFDSKDD